MRLEKSIELATQAKRSVKNLIKRSVRDSLTNIEITKAYCKIIETQLKDTPRWVRSEVRGYFDASKEFKVKPNVYFCYRIKGKLYSTQKGVPFFPHYDESGMDVSEIHKQTCGIYWKSGACYSGDECE